MKKYNFKFGLKSSKFLKLLPVSQVRLENIGTEDRPIWKNKGDVKLLFNQQRLVEQIGLDSVRNWLSSMGTPQSVSTANFSDEQLLTFVKSRYVQAPSDMLKWSEFLNNSATELLNDFDDIVKKNKKQQEFVDNLKKYRVSQNNKNE